MGLVAPRYVVSFQTRDLTHVPCGGRWILNTWTTRGDPPRCRLDLRVCVVLGSGLHWPLPSRRDDQCVPCEQGWWVSWLVWCIGEMYEHSPPSGKVWLRGVGWRPGRGRVRGDCLTRGLLPSKAPVLAMDWVSGGKGHCALVSSSQAQPGQPHTLCLSCPGQA